MKKFLVFIAFILFYFQGFSNSETTDSSGSESSFIEMVDSILQSIDYKTGEITLSGIATVKVPGGFKFLSARDAQAVLTHFWHNPPDFTILGMLVPDSIDFFANESWAITYSFEEDGYVKDDDAKDINYTELLDQMKTDTKEANEKRVKDGYEKIQLVGWAQEPFYDNATHKLHWAKEIKFETDSINTLNYNIRMLGRRGVLVMNVISGMDNLPLVKSKMNTILASTDFTKENRYEDFNSSTDKIAEYGIGALIAGGILAKTGLLAKIGIIFLKLWKVIALAVVGLVALLRKKFSGKKE